MPVSARYAAWSAGIIVGMLLPIAAGCGRQPDIEGIWEGTAGDSTVGLNICRDGSATMKVAGTARTVDYSCKWTASAYSLTLVNDAGQSVVYQIVSLTDDTLVIREGSGEVGECRLHKTSSI
jgi:hypothetical protein